MNKEGLIKLSIISDEGDTLKELMPDEAYEEIQEQVNKNGKWLFTDGGFVNTDELSAADLRPEKTYIMTNQIAGGDDPVPESTPYRTRFAFSEKMDEDIDATIDIDASQKKINIEIREVMATSFIKDREMLGRVLRETLDNVALREAKNVQDRLQVGVPINIVERQQGIHVELSTQEDLPNDIRIALDLNDNAILISINNARRFAVVSRRDYICKLFNSKLASAGQATFSSMRKAVNV